MNWAKKIQDDWWKSQQINGETMEQTKRGFGHLSANTPTTWPNITAYASNCFRNLMQYATLTA